MADKMLYERLFEETVDALTEKPKLLLHACCAPCASAVLERLWPHFEITVFFYNPNIAPQSEFDVRLDEMKRLLAEAPFGKGVSLVAPPYDSAPFYDAAKGLEDAEERGPRCQKCFHLRLDRSVAYAEENGFDFVATTLTVSPLKDAEALNTIGSALAEGKRVSWLFSDFKKKGGYQRSVELSRVYDFYRQNYCGCLYSKERAKKEKV